MSHLAKTKTEDKTKRRKKTKPPKEDNQGKKENKTNKGKKPKLRKAQNPNQERGDKPKPHLTEREKHTTNKNLN